jgi:DnaK suppressor protein
LNGKWPFRCIACGEEIAAKRLAVDPTVASCIACASGAGM